MEYTYIDKDVGRMPDFDTYKASALYKKGYDEIKIQQPSQKDYFIEIALYNYWRDQHLYQLSEKKREEWLAIEASREHQKLANYSGYEEATKIMVFKDENEYNEVFGDMKIAEISNAPDGKGFEILPDEDVPIDTQ